VRKDVGLIGEAVVVSEFLDWLAGSTLMLPNFSCDFALVGFEDDGSGMSFFAFSGLLLNAVASLRILEAFNVEVSSSMSRSSFKVLAVHLDVVDFAATFDGELFFVAVLFVLVASFAGTGSLTLDSNDFVVVFRALVFFTGASTGSASTSSTTFFIERLFFTTAESAMAQ
jgi:hypothetical protein